MHAGRVVAQLAPAMSARRECCGTQHEVLRAGAFPLRRTSCGVSSAAKRKSQSSEARSDTTGISTSMNTTVAPLDRSRSWLPPEKMLLTDL